MFDVKEEAEVAVAGIHLTSFKKFDPSLSSSVLNNIGTRLIPASEVIVNTAWKYSSSCKNFSFWKIFIFWFCVIADMFIDDDVILTMVQSK